MTDIGCLALTLRDELSRRSLLGTPEIRQACTARAKRRGDRCFAALAAQLGEANLNRGIEASRLGAGEQARFVMGFGALMTEFLVAPVCPDPDSRLLLGDLGALANLIVSYVDDMVDAGCPRAALLPESALRLAGSSGGRWMLDLTAGLAAPPAKLAARAVGEYFRRLDRLPYSSAHAWVYQDVKRCIWKMYQEEARSAADWARFNGDKRRPLKTALPLVVLGLPVWLTSQEVPFGPYWEHKRWLVRLGRFIRWIDDAADAAEDAGSGSINAVGRVLARPDVRENQPGSLARAIGCRASSLWAEWQSSMQAADSADPSVGDVFGTVLAAWLGAQGQPSGETSAV